VFAWLLFIAYLLATAWLGWRGYKRTTDFGAFAIGHGDLSPVVVGVTLAASTASAATFIINPGFIYVDGLSAFIHMVPGTGLGILTMLYLLSFRFRRFGAESKALTIPDWVGKRYRAPGFALYFSFLNLLSFAFVVLLVGGISIVMQRLLGISNVAALGITLTFVTGYVFIGGAYAHVLTNMLQGSLMILVTLVVIGSGVAIILAEPGSVAERLAAADPNLLVPVNTGGQLFNDTFSVYVAGFVIGAVLACQPHILTKALYVKTDEAVHRYLLVFAAVFFLFLLLASVGFLAHLVVPETALVDETTGAFRQDLVMTVYLQTVFPDWVFTIISVVLLAAAMSTLDGLLVSLSTITANDLVLNLVDRFSPRERTPEERMRLGMRASHVVLVVIAVAAFLVNLDPPRLLGIFGQVGVYGLAVAAAPPLIAGVLFRDTSVGLLWAASAGALAVHLGLYLYGSELLPGVELTFANPGVTGTIGAIVGIVPVLLGGWWLNRNAA
jgi:SSS family solute:Na+ symporter/sodium/pantothenate symporter